MPLILNDAKAVLSCVHREKRRKEEEKRRAEKRKK